MGPSSMRGSGRRAFADAIANGRVALVTFPGIAASPGGLPILKDGKVIGGVGVTFMQRDHVSLAPIRSGLGFRVGANVGYLKYTRRPTWNPF